MVISSPCTVKMHYTLKLDSGEVLESSFDREPLEFQYGQGQLIPGLERELDGLSVGDKKAVVVEAEDVAAIPPMEPPSPSPGVGAERPGAPSESRDQTPIIEHLQQIPRRASISPLRVIEIVLGLAALGLALATIWARRARRQ